MVVAITSEVFVVVSELEVVTVLVNQETYLPHLGVEVADVSSVVDLAMQLLLAVSYAF